MPCNADVDVIFYDTTSLHFEVDEEDELALPHHGSEYEPLRKRGHSKNGRGDAPQIVVGLAVTRDGLPVRSWVFSGETADVTTVANVKEDLRGWRLGRCVFVGDAGMNSENNRQKLALGNGKYILAARMRAGDEVTTEVPAPSGGSAAARWRRCRDAPRSSPPVAIQIPGGLACRSQALDMASQAPSREAMVLVLTIETELGEDGRRWIAEVEELPGVIVYGDSEADAVAHAQALALRVVADKIEHGEMSAEPGLALTFRAAA